ncbi:hypothetical protein IWZ00DRAFT_40962 [Phyllosticta capitalensis]|uniref:Uncharacterized protein n=2 Tax=Phyllosticta capitalensis TaxID=121624 RepID=A0ABR1Z4W1_9PEZI
MTSHLQSHTVSIHHPSIHFSRSFASSLVAFSCRPSSFIKMYHPRLPVAVGLPCMYLIISLSPSPEVPAARAPRRRQPALLLVLLPFHCSTPAPRNCCHAFNLSPSPIKSREPQSLLPFWFSAPPSPACCSNHCTPKTPHRKNKSYHSPSPTSSRRPQYADDRFPGQPCRLFVPPFFLFSHWLSPSFLRFQANHQQQKAYGVTERRHRLWTWTSRITSASRPLDTKTSCKNASRDQTAPAASVFDHNDHP